MVTDIVMIPLTLIDRDPTQPRQRFDPQGLEELARSLASEGLLQPITVRPVGERFQIVAGERRVRAARLNRWETIPAIVRDMDDRTFRKLQLLENVVRRDLNVVELARGYMALLDQGMTSKEIGQAVGRDPGIITQTVAILRNEDHILHLVERGEMSFLTAYYLSRLTPDGRLEALRRFTTNHLDQDEQIAVCKAIEARENQTEMFTETKQTPEQRKVVEDFTRSFDSACRGLARIREQEEKHPGLVGSALYSQIPVVVEQIKAMMKELAWLKHTLKKYRQTKEVLNG